MGVEKQDKGLGEATAKWKYTVCHNRIEGKVNSNVLNSSVESSERRRVRMDGTGEAACHRKSEE